MKTFGIMIAALLASNAAMACPDFSGKYKLESQGIVVNMTLTQIKCEQITMLAEGVYEGTPFSSTNVMKMDGIFRIDQNTELTTSRLYASANYFTEDSLVTDMVTYTKQDTKTVLKSEKDIAKLDASGNIVVVIQSYDAEGNLTGTERQTIVRQ